MFGNIWFCFSCSWPQSIQVRFQTAWTHSWKSINCIHNESHLSFMPLSTDDTLVCRIALPRFPSNQSNFHYSVAQPARMWKEQFTRGLIYLLLNILLFWSQNLEQWCTWEKILILNAFIFLLCFLRLVLLVGAKCHFLAHSNEDDSRTILEDVHLSHNSVPGCISNWKDENLMGRFLPFLLPTGLQFKKKPLLFCGH